MPTVYLGIGTNLGDRRANYQEALMRIERIENTVVKARSAMYETCPEGGPPQGKYINGVVAIDTGLAPSELIGILKSIERDMGREDLPLKDHPRVIDIDILLYDDIMIDTPYLKVPHPRMHRRAFVLKGLSEIAAGLVHPRLGKSIAELYEEVKKDIL
jgi:2-amino-4-hydroxy-6-hydroxymethyldihydropteridine diphosphokinase